MNESLAAARQSAAFSSVLVLSVCSQRIYVLGLLPLCYEHENCLYFSSVWKCTDSSATSRANYWETNPNFGFKFSQTVGYLKSHS